MCTLYRPEIAIAISSAIIAFCALVVSIWQMAAQRKHNKLSVRPILDWQRTTVNHVPIKWVIRNVGSGPALISKCRVKVGSQAIDFPNNKLLAVALEADGIRGYLQSMDYCGGGCIKTQEDVNVLTLDPSLAAPCVDKIEKLEWEIEYKSIYGEKFALKFNGKGT